MSLEAVVQALNYEGCRNASAKLVLIAYANYQGATGLTFAAALTIAKFTKLDLKTVRSTIAALELMGILQDTGKRVGRTAQVKVYRLNFGERVPKTDAFAGDLAAAAGALDTAENAPGAPLSADAVAPAPVPPAGDERVPKPDAFKAPVFSGEGTQKRVTEPVLEPDSPQGGKPPSPPKGRKRDRGFRIPGDWKPPAIAELSPQARRIAEQWPAGAYETHAEAFLNYWQSRGDARSRKVDWTRAWCNRIVELGAKPIRDGKNGVVYVARQQRELPPLIFDKPGEPRELCRFRRRLCDVLGPYGYRLMFDDADMRVLGEKVLITAPSRFSADKIREEGGRIDRLAAETTTARFVSVEARASA